MSSLAYISKIPGTIYCINVRNSAVQCTTCFVNETTPIFRDPLLLTSRQEKWGTLPTSPCFAIGLWEIKLLDKNEEHVIGVHWDYFVVWHSVL